MSASGHCGFNASHFTVQVMWLALQYHAYRDMSEYRMAGALLLLDRSSLPIQTRILYHFLHTSSAFFAMANAPSNVLFPPMNPLAWMKTPPGISLTLLNSSSLKPFHMSGKSLRF